MIPGCDQDGNGEINNYKADFVNFTIPRESSTGKFESCAAFRYGEPSFFWLTLQC